MVKYVLPRKQTCCHSNQKCILGSPIIAYFGNDCGYVDFYIPSMQFPSTCLEPLEGQGPSAYIYRQALMTKYS